MEIALTLIYFGAFLLVGGALLAWQPARALHLANKLRFVPAPSDRYSRRSGLAVLGAGAVLVVGALLAIVL